MLTIMTSY